MGQKKKRKQPQQSFQDMVAGATLKKFGGYINQQVAIAAQRVADQQRDSLEMIYTRLICIEEILMEKFTDIDKEVLSNRVSDIQDKSMGMNKVDGPVELGDRVRVMIRTKMKDQNEFQGQSRLLVDNAGSGETLGKDIEDAIIGMKTKEVKEIVLEQGQQVTVEITLERASRRPAPPKAPEAKESADASPNAG